MSEPTAIDVLPLTPARFADLAALFEEGGDPKWCWCDGQVGREARKVILVGYG